MSYPLLLTVMWVLHNIFEAMSLGTCNYRLATSSLLKEVKLCSNTFGLLIFFLVLVTAAFFSLLLSSITLPILSLSTFSASLGIFFVWWGWFIAFLCHLWDGTEPPAVTVKVLSSVDFHWTTREFPLSLF